MSDNSSSPLVSVCIITYNHQNYIAEAIDSVLSQETSFNFEIVVGIDLCSDDTAQIVDQYAVNNEFTILKTDHRLGMIPNWVRTLEACSGKYIAVLEGDDYWLSKNKLQMQADFLETNSAFSLCFHPLETRHEDINRDEQYLNQSPQGDVFSITDVINRSWFIGTASMMLRKKHLPKFEPWVFKQKAIDKTIQLLISSKGLIKFHKEIKGVYRIHEHGISQTQWLGKENTFHKTIINILAAFDNQTKEQYSQIIDNRIIALFKNMLSVNFDYPKTYLGLYIQLLIYKPFKTLGIKRWVLVEYLPIKWKNARKLWKP